MIMIMIIIISVVITMTSIKNKFVGNMNKPDTSLDTVVDSNCCNNYSCKVMMNMDNLHNHIYSRIILDFLFPTII